MCSSLSVWTLIIMKRYIIRERSNTIYHFALTKSKSTLIKVIIFYNKTEKERKERNKRIYLDQPFPVLLLHPSWHITLLWQPLWKSLTISTVIVDHVIPLDPPHPLLTRRIQLLVEPIISGRGRLQRRALGRTRRPHTGIGIEASVRSRERSLWPVGFDQATSCGPVVGVP